MALLERALRFRVLAVLEVTAVTFGYGGIGILLAVLGFGVWALVGAHLAQTVLKTILILVVQPHPVWPQLEKRALSDFMYFGRGFMAAQISNYSRFRRDWAYSPRNEPDASPAPSQTEGIR